MADTVDELKDRPADLWVVLARTDAQALGRLFDLTYEPVFRFCRVRLTDRTAAEDVTGEVFLAVARQVRRFKGKSFDDFQRWIYAIAANKANEYIRKGLRHKGLLGQRAADLVRPGTDDPDRQMLDWPLVQAAICKLKPGHQTILTLRFFEDMEYGPIGRIVGMSPGAVRVTVHRIVQQLKRLLHSDNEGGQGHA